VVLLSDGASRLADRFQLATWAGIGTILTGEGPAGLIQRVRAAEAADPRGERWPVARSTTTRRLSCGEWPLAPKPSAIARGDHHRLEICPRRALSALTVSAAPTDSA
jgi:hypothetical protein